MCKYIGGFKWICQASRFWFGKGDLSTLLLFLSNFDSFLNNSQLPIISIFLYCLMHIVFQAIKLNDVKSCKGTAFWMAPEVCLQSCLPNRIIE